MKMILAFLLTLAASTAFAQYPTYGNVGVCPCKADGSPCVCFPASRCPNCPTSHVAAFPTLNPTVEVATQAGPQYVLVKRCDGVRCWYERVLVGSAKPQTPAPAKPMGSKLPPMPLPVGTGGTVVKVASSVTVGQTPPPPLAFSRVRVAVHEIAGNTVCFLQEVKYRVTHRADGMPRLGLRFLR